MMQYATSPSTPSFPWSNGMFIKSAGYMDVDTGSARHCWGLCRNHTSSPHRLLLWSVGVFLLSIAVVIGIMVMVWKIGSIDNPLYWFTDHPADNSVPPYQYPSLTAGSTLQMLDGISSAAPYLAVSLHRLYRNATRAVQIQRVSDGAMLNIGFTANNTLDIASILYFSLGTNSSIVIWYDQSGSGNHMTQNSWTHAPPIVVNGQVSYSMGYPGVRFNGQPNALQYDDLIEASTVVGYVSAVANRDANCSAPLLASTTSANWASTTNLLFLSGTCAASVCVGGVATSNGTAVGTSVLTPWPPGNSILTVQPTTTAPSTTVWNNIGLDQNGVNNYAGWYLELVVFSAAPSIADQAIISTYQKINYQIGV